MRTDPRHRGSSLLAWSVILALSGWIMLSVAWSGPGGSEKLEGRAEASAQHAIMTALVNGAMSAPFRAAMGPQLSAIRSQVEALAFEDDPGSELATAALLARLGARDEALAMLTGLRARVDAGEVEADAEFRTVLDATVDLVDATGAPGQRAQPVRGQGDGALQCGKVGAEQCRLPDRLHRRVTGKLRMSLPLQQRRAERGTQEAGLLRRDSRLVQAPQVGALGRRVTVVQGDDAGQDRRQGNRYRRPCVRFTDQGLTLRCVLGQQSGRGGQDIHGRSIARPGDRPGAAAGDGC